MTIWFYIHSIAKRVKSIALLDLRAMENFMNLSYAKWLQLPIKQLPQPRPVLNVDGTENKSSKLKYYTDLNIWTGQNTTTLRFFLSDLGEHKVILRYPWFAVMQPRIDWKRGSINHTQLPIVIRAPNAQKAVFVPRIQNIPRPTQKERYFLCKVTVHLDQPEDTDLIKVPEEFHHHAKVFSEQRSQWLPKRTVWDHAIKLLPNDPKFLAGRLLQLPQDEIRKLTNLQKNTYKGAQSDQPYAASFFFVKKADGKLHPVQDYWPLNKYMKKNQNMLLHPRTILGWFISFCPPFPLTLVMPSTSFHYFLYTSDSFSDILHRSLMFQTRY